MKKQFEVGVTYYTESLGFITVAKINREEDEICFYPNKFMQDGGYHLHDGLVGFPLSAEEKELNLPAGRMGRIVKVRTPKV